MSIFDWIEKVRKKPEVERRRILVGSTFLITGLIFVVWLSVRLYGFEDVNKTVVAKKESGPISELFDTFGKFSDNFKEGVASIKNVLSSSTTTTSSTTSVTTDILEP